ncbi:gastrula zinc finger protein XlCGF57.1-like isoform X1 [Synchiropus splendidus]|uniref:gastrula zinc finger protein XlCGF57.1-like isoform X1 n=2 Tax=Synchiropus splendidus TaxID=270530 RepID=UPI00237ED272|nr:gastrula zinc finger protein XlCGF57.1-like isoform X1 [Synchiropus splendidus]
MLLHVSIICFTARPRGAASRTATLDSLAPKMDVDESLQLPTITAPVEDCKTVDLLNEELDQYTSCQERKEEQVLTTDLAETEIWSQSNAEEQYPGQTESDEEDVKPNVEDLAAAFLKGPSESVSIPPLKCLSICLPDCLKDPSVIAAAGVIYEDAALIESSDFQDAPPKSKPFNCGHCGKAYASRSHLLRHQDFFCSLNVCDEETEDLASLFQCDTCSRKFRSEKQLKAHKCSRNGEGETCGLVPRERSHPCTLCDKSFFSSANLQQHQLTHTGERSHNCTVCGKSFARLGTLKSHQLVHTGEKLFQCEQCGKKSIRMGDLKVHMLTHSQELPFTCNYCGKNFRQVAKLKLHQRVHTGEKPYQCQVCQKQFSHQQSLSVHMFTHTGEKPFICCTCSKGFADKNNLRKHELIHAGIKPYSCSYCSRGFRLHHQMVFHERTHTGEKPYKCGICQKSFTQHSGFKRHQQIHELKPHSCPQCGKNVTSLSGHQCEISAERPHQCPQCKKGFSHATNLAKHMVIHTGHKPYPCTECGKQFNDRSNLRKHMRIHTNERPFECVTCAKRFRLQHHLTHHLESCANRQKTTDKAHTETGLSVG